MYNHANERSNFRCIVCMTIDKRHKCSCFMGAWRPLLQVVLYECIMIEEWHACTAWVHDERKMSTTDKHYLSRCTWSLHQSRPFWRIHPGTCRRQHATCLWWGAARTARALGTSPAIPAHTHATRSQLKHRTPLMPVVCNLLQRYWLFIKTFSSCSLRLLNNIIFITWADSAVRGGRGQEAHTTNLNSWRFCCFAKYVNFCS